MKKNWKIAWYIYCFRNIVLAFCEKKCSSDKKKLLKFEAEGQELAKVKRSLEPFL